MLTGNESTCKAWISVCFLQPLPEPPELGLHYTSQTSETPNLGIMWWPCGSFPGCCFELAPGPSEGSSSKQLVSFVTWSCSSEPVPVSAQPWKLNPTAASCSGRCSLGVRAGPSLGRGGPPGPRALLCPVVAALAGSQEGKMAYKGFKGQNKAFLASLGTPGSVVMQPSPAITKTTA